MGKKKIVESLPHCGRLNDDLSKISESYTLEPVNMLPYMVKGTLQGSLRILQWGNYPGSFNNITRVLLSSRRQKGEDQRDRR